MRVLCLVLVTGLIMSCSSTKIQSVWHMDTFKFDQVQKIMVVAKAEKVTTRAIFESSFVEQLKKKGFDAVSSYEAVPKETLNKEELYAYVKENQITHVLMIQLAGVDVEKEYIKPKQITYYTPSSTYYYYDRAYRYGTLYTHWDEGTTLTYEGRIDQRTITLLETLLYQVDKETLVWAGKSSSYEAYNAMDMSKEVASKIVAQMK